MILWGITDEQLHRAAQRTCDLGTWIAGGIAGALLVLIVLRLAL
jgi:hypothetical protein